MRMSEEALFFVFLSGVGDRFPISSKSYVSRRPGATASSSFFLSIMSRFLRIVTVITLPILTLALGWQLGVSYEQNVLREATAKLNLLYGRGGSGTVLADPESEADLSLLYGVWRLLLNRYIAPEELTTQKMLFGAVDGLVRAIGDPYTVFMTPSQNRDFRQALEGKLQGIGAELAFRDGQVVVVAPLKGSPAQTAGVLPEDIIIEVDGIDITGENLNQVVQRIRGKKGTTVTIKIVREGSFNPLTLSIVRDNITIPSVESRLIESGSGSVAYIALNQFGDNSIDELRVALQGFMEQSPKGLIVDVRFNGGGYLESAVELTSLFLRQGMIVSVERREGEPEPHYAYGRPLAPDLPLVVLINQGSASASEIVAGALKDHKRATIIGMKSFGKGTVQEVIDLPGGSSLRVTTAHWLTPGGKNLGKEGVHPDIVVDRTAEDLQAERDPQLDAALEWLLDYEDVTGGQKTGSGAQQ